MPPDDTDGSALFDGHYGGWRRMFTWLQKKGSKNAARVTNLAIRLDSPTVIDHNCEVRLSKKRPSHAKFKRVLAWSAEIIGVCLPRQIGLVRTVWHKEGAWYDERMFMVFDFSERTASTDGVSGKAEHREAATERTESA